MARTVDLWIGKGDDTPIPPRVKLRIFEREQGRCYLCEQPIQAGERWHAEHRVAVINGGLNGEANLSPAHVSCHQIKTQGDLKEKAKVAAVRKAHLGITRPTQKIVSAPFAKTAKAAARAPKPPVPRQRSFYQQKEETQP